MRCLPVLLALACAREEPVPGGGPVAGWPVYGGDPGGTRHSILTQIDPSNVARLAVAWTYHTGDAADDEQKTAFQATPILADDTLYLCSPQNRVIALDAGTGAERWTFDPHVGDMAWTLTCRGVATWLDPTRSAGAACRRRIFTGTRDARLFALDAATGELCSDFGDAGSVDLAVGVGRRDPEEYGVTSPPAVIGDVVAVGALVADNRRTDAPSGVVRGFDPRTGALRWSFDPVPPGTPPAAPLPDGRPAYHRGTPNAWSVFSADPERDLLFVPTGNASPDFFGGLRRGFDHFASSVVALRGSTGEVVWRFQTVHHDLWDYDVSSQPTLIDVDHGGRRRSALLQATKMGHLFLLDRETGEPLYPVEERPVPRSEVPGETSAPTQPFPSFPAPLQADRFGPEDAFGLTPFDRRWCRRRIESLRYEGIFTPPSLEGSIQFPGVAGGANWGGVAVDPERRLAVVNLNRIANVITLVPRERAAGVVNDPPRMSRMPQEGTPYVGKWQVLMSPLGIPCSPPPWGTLVAVDLATGAVRWKRPFGTTRGMAPFPFSLLSIEWGLPSLGGPIVTASGLAFIAAAMDDALRAYDVATGEELWQARLPAGAQATPMTYRLREDGRQFVVIAAGGHGTMGTTAGDALVAFALP